jgi:mRNA interferase MazF
VKRGDIATAAPPGEFGKPRPVLIVQALTDVPPERVTVALITADLLRHPLLRIPIEPTIQNGLQLSSEVAVDNIQTFSVRKLGNVIGSVDALTMRLVDAAMSRHLGLS